MFLLDQGFALPLWVISSVLAMQLPIEPVQSLSVYPLILNDVHLTLFRCCSKASLDERDRLLLFAQ